MINLFSRYSLRLLVITDNLNVIDVELNLHCIYEESGGQGAWLDLLLYVYIPYNFICQMNPK